MRATDILSEKIAFARREGDSQILDIRADATLRGSIPAKRIKLFKKL